MERCTKAIVPGNSFWERPGDNEAAILERWSTVLERIKELTELLGQIEGSELDPEHEQRMRDLRMRWSHADTSFHAGFYCLKRYGPDDVPTVEPALSDLRESFRMLEECCREWREEMKRILPDEH